MENVADRDLHALVELLRDDDAALREQIAGHLARYGDQALAVLDRVARATDPKHRARIGAARDGVLRARTLDRLRDFAALGSAAREDYGAALIAQLADPALKVEGVLAELDDLARDCPDAARAADSQASLEGLRGYLHSHLGFHGNHADYYDPENSLIHRVLARRTGIPITLAVVYLALARRLGQPATGIGLPGHFIVRWGDAEPPLYVDPFDAGALLTELDCARVVQQHGVPLKAEHLRPVDAQEIAARIARNLIGVWRHRGERTLEALARAAHARLRPEIALPE